MPQDRSKRRTVAFSDVIPRAMELATQSLVEMAPLRPDQKLGLVVAPRLPDVDLIEWARNNKDFVDRALGQHGAILFQGFELTPARFESFARVFWPELCTNYGDLPKEDRSSNVYRTTPYPQDRTILYHNEGTHTNRWPRHVFFYCAKAADTGGETPLVDCARLVCEVDPEVIDRLERLRLKYVRNFDRDRNSVSGLDVSWEEFFKTADRAEVEQQCRRDGIEFEWKGANGLRTSIVCPAVGKHPKTGAKVLVNQILTHHVSCLDEDLRKAVFSFFDEDSLPRSVYFGDGTPISDSIVGPLLEVYRRSAVVFPWRPNSLVMVDNLLVAHGRHRYTGTRRHLVALGEMLSPSEI